MKSEHCPNERGLTIIEVLSTISIILILASMLLASIYAAREKGRKAVCINNLKNLTASILLNANDEDKFPTQIAWDNLRSFEPLPSGGGSLAYAAVGDYYDHRVEITRCPKIFGSILDDPAVYSYGMNQLIRAACLHVLKDPSNTVVVAETKNFSVIGNVDSVDFRHFRQCLAGFADGHVQTIQEIQLRDSKRNYSGLYVVQGLYGIEFSTTGEFDNRGHGNNADHDDEDNAGQGGGNHGFDEESATAESFDGIDDDEGVSFTDTIDTSDPSDSEDVVGGGTSGGKKK